MSITVNENNKSQDMVEKYQDSLLSVHRKTSLHPEESCQVMHLFTSKSRIHLSAKSILLSLCFAQFWKGAFSITCDTNPVPMYKGLCAPLLSYHVINKGFSRVEVQYYQLHTLVQLRFQFVIYNFIPVICPVILHCSNKE